ncbi:MAG TPA: hypothetical protein PLN76_13190 [Saprospiraceae bacterium]|nr:hypothetical protein [Saprospiraceae bacterium]
MPILDKIKSIFIVPDENASAAQSENSNPETLATQTNDNPPKSEVSGQPNEKFLEILAGVLEKNNLPGFDYFEYRKAVQSIAKLQTMDEATQYKTAYAAAQSMNVSHESLISSANKYLSLLEVEETNFNQSANNYLNQQLASKKSEETQLQDQVQKITQQIEELKAKLETDKTRLTNLQEELGSVSRKVEANKANFKASYQNIVEEIRTDIQKMEKYLK